MPRLVLVVVLVTVALTTSAAADVDPRVVGEPYAEPPHAVNTVCPVQGERVDREVDVVVVRLIKDGEPVDVAVGLCCDRCARQLALDPQRYAAAALENRRARR